MHVQRTVLLTALEQIQAGLTTRDIIEQSACFVFKDGRIWTFNDEVSCSVPSPLKIEGAITAASMIGILRKLPEDDLTCEVQKGALIINGKKKQIELKMEKKIRLPIDQLETPEEWVKLDDNFSEAIFLAHQCCGRDEKEFQNTCIAITPKYIEAFDNMQAIRYKLKTKIEEPSLVRGSCVRHITSLNMTKMGVSEAWIHFKNGSGLRYSVRREVQDREIDLSPIFKVEGSRLVLPKGLSEASDRGSEFSKENVDDNEITVQLKKGKIRVIGAGLSGKIKEWKTLKGYKGEDFSFKILPALLSELVKKYNECEVAEEQLRVSGENFTYIVSIGNPDKEQD